MRALFLIVRGPLPVVNKGASRAPRSALLSALRSLPWFRRAAATYGHGAGSRRDDADLRPRSVKVRESIYKVTEHGLGALSAKFEFEVERCAGDSGLTAQEVEQSLYVVWR